MDLNAFINPDVFDVPTPIKTSKESYLNLSSNEWLIGLPSIICRSLYKHAIPSNVNKYAVFEKLKDGMEKHLSIPRENFVITAGSDDAIRHVFNAILRNADTHYIVQPNYYAYSHYSRLVGLNENIINISINNMIGIEGIINRVVSENSVVTLSNPNGITGAYFEQEDLLKLIKKCKSLNSLVVVDEAYIGFFGVSLKNYINLYDNLVIIQTLSKSFASPGLRIGVVIAHDLVISAISKWNSLSSISRLSVEIITELFNHYETIDKCIELIKVNKHYVESEINNLFDDLNTICTRTNFSLVKSDRVPIKVISKQLKDHGIYVRDLSDICGAEKCFRFTVGKRTDMRRLLETLDIVIKKY